MHLHGGDVASSESIDKPGFSIGGLSQDERVPVRRLKKASYLAVAMSGLPPLATELRTSLVVRLVPTTDSCNAAFSTRFAAMLEQGRPDVGY